MSLLNIDGITVSRGGATVLRDVTLRVHPRQVVALLGSNGVGKSTTLRTVSGLHRASKGNIELDGREITKLPPHELVSHGIAHVPEGRQIFAGLTVRENLEMGARSAGGLTASRLERSLALFPPLENALGKSGGTLSGGQQQMLAIARGLASEPRLLLLDEPSLGLAPKVVKDIAHIVSQLPNLGVSILLVEQNATMALDVADYGYLMSGGMIRSGATAGELRQSGDVREVYLGRRDSDIPKEGNSR